MRILVTGGTGFIGRHVVATLGDRHELLAIARRKPPPELAGKATWLEHDLTAPLNLSALPASVDAVIHLAQSTRYREFPEGALDMMAVNTQSTLNLLEYARQASAQAFAFTSTGGVYGYGYERLVEHHPVNPLNFYLSSKYAAELLMANYRHYFRTVVLRPFFVYGPGQTGMLIANLIERVAEGEAVTIQGDPGLRTNPVYVGDVVRVLEPVLALDESELLNVAGDEPVTLTDLVTLIGELVGREPNVAHSGDEPPGDLVADNSRLKQLLGIDSLTPLHEGLRLTIEARTIHA